MAGRVESRERLLPGSAADALVPESTALLMWDLQEGLGGRASDRPQLEPVWRALVASAHAAGVQVVWSRHIAPPPHLMSDTEVWRIMRRQRIESPAQLKPYMQRDTEETSFLPGFSPVPGDIVVEKSTPSLFVDTPADARLRAAGVRSIAIVGVATDIGIEFTARHALALGYFPVVVRDGCGAYTSEAHERSLASLASVALVTESSTVLSCWDKP